MKIDYLEFFWNGVRLGEKGKTLKFINARCNNWNEGKIIGSMNYIAWEEWRSKIKLKL
jgi:hypothetical protein